MAVKIDYSKERLIVTEASSVQAVDKGYFGLPVNGKKDKLELLLKKRFT